MAIRAGQILHVANQFVVDRIQTAGPGDLNIPQERIYELGNYKSVGIVRDVPDLSFNLECLDVDTEVEAMLVGSADPGADAAGTVYDLSLARIANIISPWKSPYGDFDAVRGIAIPQLTLESASYRYGLRENAGETFTLRGDSIYYIPGSPYQQDEVGDNTTTNFPFDNTALTYTEGGVDKYGLSVAVDGVRQFRGTDYTEDSSGVTFTTAPATGAKITLIYGSATVATYGQGVHQDLSVKPAAIRGKDIDVYFSTAIPGVDLGNGIGQPLEVRWPDVQSATVEHRVTLEDDYEFGNPVAVGRDFVDVPQVTGSVEVKPRTIEAWFDRLRQITGISDPAKIMGPQSSIAGALRIELRNPESGGSTASAAGTPLKTLYIPAARFTMPGYEGRVQQKVAATINYESDDGVLEVIKGARA